MEEAKKRRATLPAMNERERGLTSGASGYARASRPKIQVQFANDIKKFGADAANVRTHASQERDGGGAFL